MRFRATSPVEVVYPNELREGARERWTLQKRRKPSKGRTFGRAEFLHSLVTGKPNHPHRLAER